MAERWWSENKWCRKRCCFRFSEAERYDSDRLPNRRKIRILLSHPRLQRTADMSNHVRPGCFRMPIQGQKVRGRESLQKQGTFSAFSHDKPPLPGSWNDTKYCNCEEIPYMVHRKHPLSPYANSISKNGGSFKKSEFSPFRENGCFHMETPLQPRGCRGVYHKP